MIALVAESPSQSSKAALRARVRAEVTAIAPDRRAALSESIARRIIGSASYAQARTIMSFLAAPSEPDLASVHTAALAAGKRLAVPRTRWPSGAMAAIV